MQTTPLEFLDDIRQHPHALVGAPVRNLAIMQVALNVLLFVPLGFFLRMISRRGNVGSTLDARRSTLDGLGILLAME